MQTRQTISVLAISAILETVAGCGGGGDGAQDVVADTLYAPWPTPFYAITVEENLVYGQGEVNGGGDWKELRLDIYKPDEWSPNPGKRFPLLVMLHGGGFSSGGKRADNIVGYATEYAQRGWIVAAITYRLTGDDPIPSARMQTLYDHVGQGSISLYNRTVIAAIEDMLVAVEFLQQRDDIYAPWTTVWGYSAGGIIALNGAYILDDHSIERPDVASVISLAGHFGENGAYTGRTPFDDPAGSDPSLMLIHGTLDGTFEKSKDIQALATAAGLPLDYQPVANIGHSVDLFNHYANTGVTLFQRSVDYMRETVFADYEPGPVRN